MFSSEQAVIQLIKTSDFQTSYRSALISFFPSKTYTIAIVFPDNSFNDFYIYLFSSQSSIIISYPL